MKNKIIAAILSVFCLSLISCEKTSSISDNKSKAEISSIREKSSEQPLTSAPAAASAVTSAVSEPATESQPSTEPVKLSGSKTVPVYEELTINEFLTEANIVVLNGSDLLQTESKRRTCYPYSDRRSEKTAYAGTGTSACRTSGGLLHLSEIRKL